MTSDIQILRELPLKELISAPLNAVIEAQADAAMTTVAFIERIGMITDSGNLQYRTNEISKIPNDRLFKFEVKIIVD